MASKGNPPRSYKIMQDLKICANCVFADYDENPTEPGDMSCEYYRHHCVPGGACDTFLSFEANE